MNTGIIAAFKNLVPLALYASWIFFFLFSLSGRARWGIFFLIPLLPLQNVFAKLQAFPLGNQLNDILFIGMMIGWVVSKSIKGERLFQRTSFNWLLLVCFVYTYFSLWQGSFYLGFPAPLSIIDPRVQAWKNYVTFFVIFILVSNNLNDSKDIKRLFWFMAFVMLLMNYSTLDQVKWATSWESRTKITGTFQWLGANEVAAFYATYTFVLFGVFLFTRKILPKLGLLVLLLQNAYFALFMFSRGAYAAIVLAIGFISLVRKKILLVPLIIILVSWQTILPERVVERIQFTEQSYGTLDPSAGKRLELWQESLEYFKTSPVIGIGFKTFSSIGERRDTHNVFLKVLCEQGIIGIVLLFFIILLSLKRGWRLYKTAKDDFLKGLGLGFVACTLALIVGNCFGDRWTHFPLGAFFWAYLGMVELGNRITEEERKKNREDVRTLGRADVKRPVGKIENSNRRVKMWNVRRGEA